MGTTRENRRLPRGLGKVNQVLLPCLVSVGAPWTVFLLDRAPVKVQVGKGTGISEV